MKQSEINRGIDRDISVLRGKINNLEKEIADLKRRLEDRPKTYSIDLPGITLENSDKLKELLKSLAQHLTARNTSRS